MTHVPRRIVFRTLGSLLLGLAEQYEARPLDSIRRRGAQAVEGAVRKQQGHAFKAEQCRKHGHTLLRWTGEETRYKGADVDIRLLGWLCAHCFLFAGAHLQITSMAPPGAMDGVVWGDIPDVVWRAIQ